LWPNGEEDAGMQKKKTVRRKYGVYQLCILKKNHCLPTMVEAIIDRWIESSRKNLLFDKSIQYRPFLVWYGFIHPQFDTEVTD
jgi:hypothetical protein